MPEMTLEYVLRKHGLEPGKDVEVSTVIQFAAMAGGFQGGEGGYTPSTRYSTTKSYMGKNSEVIQEFTNVINKGMKWVESHSGEKEIVNTEFDKKGYEIVNKLINIYNSKKQRL